MMKLLSATPSPYARKVRITLTEKGLPFELLTEVPWNANTMVSQHNPLEKLPVLILDDGRSFYESRFILEYLEIEHPEPPMFPKDSKELLAAKRLEVLADGICDAAILVIFERQRAMEHRSTPWEARQMRKIKGGFKEVDRLVPREGFCIGDKFGLADIAVGSLLDFISLRLTDIEWKVDFPNLVAFQERLAERPSFRNTVPREQQIDQEVV